MSRTAQVSEKHVTLVEWKLAARRAVVWLCEGFTGESLKSFYSRAVVAPPSLPGLSISSNPQTPHHHFHDEKADSGSAVLRLVDNGCCLS